MEDLVQLSYSVDTFYFLVMGVLVMFMAPGFAMLEAGMVQSKNTSEILTKNVALFAIASVMYLLIGYANMYGGGGLLIGSENTVDDVLASGGDVYYSARSDFFFQVVFVATAMSIISGAVAERMKLWSFLLFAVVMTGAIYPYQGSWSWGGGWLSEMGFSDFAGSTSSMVDYVKKKQPKKVLLVTECSMSDNIQIENPKVNFVKPCNLCPYMKKITLKKIFDCLANETNEIKIGNNIATRARKSVTKMADIGR